MVSKIPFMKGVQKNASKHCVGNCVKDCVQKVHEKDAHKNGVTTWSSKTGYTDCVKKKPLKIAFKIFVIKLRPKRASTNRV